MNTSVEDLRQSLINAMNRIIMENPMLPCPHRIQSTTSQRCGYRHCGSCFQIIIENPDDIPSCFVCNKPITPNYRYANYKDLILYHPECEAQLCTVIKKCSNTTCDKPNTTIVKVYDTLLENPIVRNTYCNTCALLRISHAKNHINDGTFKPICYYCEKVVEKCLKCSGCGLRYYCGKECQTADWSNHKQYCTK